MIKQVLESQDLVEYQKFLSFIHEERCDEEELLAIISESRNCVGLLSFNFRAYIETLLNLNWQKRSDKFTEEFKCFIVDLVVAHNKYCAVVISMLVARFVPNEEELLDWHYGTPSEQISHELKHTHDLLDRILEVIPMAFDILLRQLGQQFPFYKKPAEVIGGYIHSLLQLIAYRPIFQEDVLILIVVKLLGIDVNCSRHEIEDAENQDEEEKEEEMFKMDEVKEEEDPDQMKHSLAESLDLGMLKMLEYVKTVMTESSKLEQDKLCGIFFKVFDSDIILTHNSHHVQFLIFYLVHFKTAILEQFLDKLWTSACNFNLAPGVRQASIAYLASLLARAKFISVNLLKSFLTDMTNWAHQYIQRSDTISSNHSMKAHTVFYSICQAIFYIIAFRSRELTADRKSLLHLQSMQLQALVTSHLNPLKVCLPAVATTFAGVTRSHQLAYCHTILERNARRKLATIYSNESLMPEECLDTFFPFDPYLLKKSGKLIETLYLHYQASDDEQLSPEKDGKGRKRMESFSTNNDEDDFICDDRKKRLKNLARSFEEELSFGASPGFGH